MLGIILKACLCVFLLVYIFVKIACRERAQGDYFRHNESNKL